MARPKKNNCDYFPHDNNMRNHIKVKAIRNKDPNGFAIWVMFLEHLTSSDGNVFEYSDLQVEDAKLDMKGEIKLSISVKNSGKITGKEVVQVYIHDKISSVTTPVKVLKEFKKLSADDMKRLVDYAKPFSGMIVENYKRVLA